MKGLSIKEGETSPPKRYNSGSMILAMENAGSLIEDEELRSQIKGSGIGTSATRAEILKKLVANKYLALNKKTQVLTPTQLGEMIFCVVNVSIRIAFEPGAYGQLGEGSDLCGGGNHFPGGIHGEADDVHPPPYGSGHGRKLSDGPQGHVRPALNLLSENNEARSKTGSSQKGGTDSMMETCKIENLYDLKETIAAELFEGAEYPWEVLGKIKDFIVALGNTLSEEEYEKREGNVWIARSAKVAPTAFIGENVIIGKDAEVRHCAFIRGNAIVGEGAVVGNSTELKNVVLFNKVQVPHYNYVGDSILGYKAHMGAGSITSNVKSDKKLVVVKAGEEKIETGLKKFGAMLGDRVEVGCGSVLNPGTVIGHDSNIYPLSSVRGVVPAGSIYKKQGEVVEKY